MLERIKGLVKDESGQITTTEVVILVAVIALVAGLFGNGLQEVFTGDNGKGGAVGKLNDFVTNKFDAVLLKENNS